MTTYASLKTDVKDRILTITLNRPERLNAFNFDMATLTFVAGGIDSKNADLLDFFNLDPGVFVFVALALSAVAAIAAAVPALRASRVDPIEALRAE